MCRQRAIDDSDIAVINAGWIQVCPRDTKEESRRWVRDEQVVQVEGLVDVVIVRTREARGE